jgi:integrase
MPLYKRESGIWYYDITLASGKRIRGSTHTKDKRQAEELHDKLKHETWRHANLGEKPKYLWDEAALRWIKEKTGVKKSIKADISRLRQLTELRGVYLHHIDRNLITSVINEKNCSDSTKNRYLALIRAILNACVREWDMLDKNVHIKLFQEPKHRVKWLWPKDARKLLNCLIPYMADMAEYDLATGLRQANVFDLKWHQIDFQRRTCEYYPENMKSGKPLVIPLNDTAINVLTRQLGKHEKYVFVHSRNQPVKSLNYKLWKEALDKAGIEEDFHWHDLRHTWASWLVQNGVSLYALKEMGGWQSLEMVQKYAHLAPEHLVKHAMKIDNIMTSDCHNLGTANKPEEEVVTVEMMRKMLKEMEDKWWVVRGSNPGQMD